MSRRASSTLSTKAEAIVSLAWCKEMVDGGRHIDEIPLVRGIVSPRPGINLGIKFFHVPSVIYHDADDIEGSRDRQSLRTNDCIAFLV
jgi:hypothetical protein